MGIWAIVFSSVERYFPSRWQELIVVSRESEPWEGRTLGEIFS
jgi:hypothetical protein